MTIAWAILIGAALIAWALLYDAQTARMTLAERTRVDAALVRVIAASVTAVLSIFVLLFGVVFIYAGIANGEVNVGGWGVLLAGGGCSGMYGTYRLARGVGCSVRS